MQEISIIQEKLAVVKDEIRKLTMPEDPLLGVLEDEDGDPFIEKLVNWNPFFHPNILLNLLFRYELSLLPVLPHLQ